MDDLYQEAVKAWYKHCKENSLTFIQPSGGRIMPSISGEYYYLENVAGPLAKYDVQKKEIVVRGDDSELIKLVSNFASELARLEPDLMEWAFWLIYLDVALEDIAMNTVDHPAGVEAVFEKHRDVLSDRLNHPAGVGSVLEAMRYALRKRLEKGS